MDDLPARGINADVWRQYCMGVRWALVAQEVGMPPKLVITRDGGKML